MSKSKALKLVEAELEALTDKREEAIQKLLFVYKWQKTTTEDIVILIGEIETLQRKKTTKLLEYVELMRAK